MTPHGNWTDEELEYLLALDGTNQQKAIKLTNKFNLYFSGMAVKKKLQRIKTNKVIPGYKESTEILSDGSYKSDKLLKMSQNQSKDKNYLLKAHGFDKSEWEIITAKSNLWNVYSKIDKVQQLYSSKITVKPKKNSIDYDKLIEVIERRTPIKPIEFEGKPLNKPTYLEIPLFDLHFGNSTLEYYKETLRKTLELLEKSYNKVLFIIGQDLLHNDNFKGETANGTKIDKVNMEVAWDEAEQFYVTLINKAIKNSLKVSVIYIKGNHDESMSWAFVRDLKSYYRKEPRITFDTRFKERKAHMLGLNFIGTTHGDKNRNNAASNFSVEFPEMWSKATTREVHMGHLHRKRATKKPIEFINDSNGVIVRELGTGNDIDQYHDDYGYTMAHKEFEIFEYTETNKDKIHYV